MVEGESASLGALLLRLTCPGVPDIYQGDELWSLELVDPDNRRPVDWDALRASVDRVRALASADGEAPERHDRKLHVIREVLALRARRPAPFAGDYVPLSAPPDTCAFTRGDEVAVIVGLRRDAIVGDISLPGAQEGWRELPVEPSGSAPIRLLERHR